MDDRLEKYVGEAPEARSRRLDDRVDVSDTAWNGIAGCDGRLQAARTARLYAHCLAVG